jgi:DNA sulfur modification protein DndD
MKLEIQVKKRDRWVKTGSTDILDPVFAPFILYQGENSMFISTNDPFSDKGILHRIVGSLSGSFELESAHRTLRENFDLLTEQIKNKGDKVASIEKEMSALGSESKILEEKRKESMGRVEALREETRNASNMYRTLLNELSSAEREMRDRQGGTESAARLGRLEERLSNAWSSAYVDLLRDQATRAIKKAVGKKEESTRKRIMFGVHESQLNIVKEILDRRSCICGASIGRSGMGRERLRHMIETLEERKKEVSDWETECIWCSDKMLTKAAMDLSGNGSSRERILGMLKDVGNLSRSIREAPIREDERTRLIEAVRSHERSKILLQEEKKHIREYEKEIRFLESRINDLRTEMTDLIGSGEGKTGLEERLEATKQALPKARSLIAEGMERTREELEKSSSEILRNITGRDDLDVRIHGMEYTIGRKSDDGRIVPLTRLSAGERESLILSLILGISRMTGSGIILDSPFTGMEANSIDRCIKTLSGYSGNILVLVPDGSIPYSFEAAARYNLVASKGSLDLKEA